jgi:hypothetical protein
MIQWPSWGSVLILDPHLLVQGYKRKMKLVKSQMGVIEQGVLAK